MNTLLNTTLSLLVGTIITVNGVGVKADDIIANTKTVVNQANIHQFATALELYYLDHNNYPDVTGGEALVDRLQNDGYITNRPLNPDVFHYQPRSNGQDYNLTIAVAD